MSKEENPYSWSVEKNAICAELGDPSVILDRVTINECEYHVGESGSGLIHAILLLVDAIKENKT